MDKWPNDWVGSADDQVGSADDQVGSADDQVGSADDQVRSADDASSTAGVAKDFSPSRLSGQTIAVFNCMPWHLCAC